MVFYSKSDVFTNWAKLEMYFSCIHPLQLCSSILLDPAPLVRPSRRVIGRTYVNHMVPPTVGEEAAARRSRGPSISGGDVNTPAHPARPTTSTSRLRLGAAFAPSRRDPTRRDNSGRRRASEGGRSAGRPRLGSCPRGEG